MAGLDLASIRAAVPREPPSIVTALAAPEKTVPASGRAGRRLTDALEPELHRARWPAAVARCSTPVVAPLSRLDRAVAAHRRRLHRLAARRRTRAPIAGLDLTARGASIAGGLVRVITGFRRLEDAVATDRLGRRDGLASRRLTHADEASLHAASRITPVARARILIVAQLVRVDPAVPTARRLARVRHPAIRGRCAGVIDPRVFARGRRSHRGAARRLAFADPARLDATTRAAAVSGGPASVVARLRDVDPPVPTRRAGEVEARGGRPERDRHPRLPGGPEIDHLRLFGRGVARARETPNGHPELLGGVAREQDRDGPRGHARPERHPGRREHRPAVRPPPVGLHLADRLVGIELYDEARRVVRASPGERDGKTYERKAHCPRIDGRIAGGQQASTSTGSSSRIAPGVARMRSPGREVDSPRVLRATRGGSGGPSPSCLAHPAGAEGAAGRTTRSMSLPTVSPWTMMEKTTVA